MFDAYRLADKPEKLSRAGKGTGGRRSRGVGQCIGLFSWSLIYFYLRICEPRFAVRRGAVNITAPIM